MLKKIIAFAVIIIVLFSPCPLMANQDLKETKVPDDLNPGLNHLLALISPDNKDNFDLRRIEKVLDFVTSPKRKSALYYAEKKFGANSAYYEFDIRSDLEHILRYAFNPEIPSFIFRPSSVRLSYWSECNGQNQPIPKLWNFLPSLDSPITTRGVEHVEITPDLFSGGYYQYDDDVMLILCKYLDRNLFMIISKQKDKSNVGKKGLILGKDEDWYYFYSGQTGLTKTGLGWVNSYMYDSFSVSFYYEIDKKTPFVRCGTFKWLKAGWSNFNLAKQKHIHKGLERFANDYKAIIEHPSLPKPSELASRFSHYEELSLNDLRKKVKSHIKILESLLDYEKHRYKSFAEYVKSGKYLNQMTRQEMQAILALENMKIILRQ